MMDTLKKELQTYESNRAELIGKYEGKFALIRGEEVSDVFDTKTDAIRQGYKKFGLVPFLVKQIVEIEIPQNFISNLLRI